MDNYGPMTVFHHRIKTFGAWTVKQPFSGIFIWRSPQGEHYLVDHTGTRKVTKGAGEETRAGRAGDIGIEVYGGQHRIGWEYNHAC